jgi:hypothetical protein
MTCEIHINSKTVQFKGEFTLAEFIDLVNRLFKDDELKEYKLVFGREVEYTPQPYPVPQPYPIYPSPSTPDTPWYGEPLIKCGGTNTSVYEVSDSGFIIKSH